MFDLHQHVQPEPVHLPTASAPPPPTSTVHPAPPSHFHHPPSPHARVQTPHYDSLYVRSHQRYPRNPRLFPLFVVAGLGTWAYCRLKRELGDVRAEVEGMRRETGGEGVGGQGQGPLLVDGGRKWPRGWTKEWERERLVGGRETEEKRV